jgi:hypothetical protein
MEFHDPRMRAISNFKRTFGGRPRPSMEGVLVLNEGKAASANLVRSLARKVRNSEMIKRTGSVAGIFPGRSRERRWLGRAF